MPSFDLQFLDGIIDQDALNDPARRELLTPWMRRNHDAHVPVKCLCSPGNPDGCLLSVVLKGETLFLRRYQGTESQHHPECRFNEEIPDRSKAGRNIPGIQEDSDGGYHVALGPDVFPGRREVAESLAEALVPGRRTRSEDRTSTVRGRISLPGLLRFLLDKSGMCEWKPGFAGRRSATSLSRRVDEIAQRCLYGRGALSDLLAAPTQPLRGASLDEMARQRPNMGDGSAPEIMLFDSLLGVWTAPSGKSMMLRTARCTDPVFCRTPAWAEYVESNPLVLRFEDSGHPILPVWILATLRPFGNGGAARLGVSNFAALAVSPDFVPCESGPEVDFARFLVSRSRSFRKPLRYHKADDSSPDFLLIDTEPYTACEVWGRNDESYRAKIPAMREVFARSGTPLVEWDAANGAPMPVLPPASISATR